ncbi:unnamed protein product [Meloidogyne enterolobii]|uniref:Uncharacterized protein n=1 Tax=Meloidogyne enterolobii TaxID=390850 RepID=A0ACB1A2G8_MELEN
MQSVLFKNFSFSFASKLNFSTTTTKKIDSVVAHKSARLPSGFNPITPFAVFVKEKMKNSTGEKASELVKKVAKSWKEMSDLDKKSYVENAKIISQKRKDEFSQFSVQQQEDLMKSNASLIEKRKRGKLLHDLHEFYKQTNKPKRPMNGFLLFCKDGMEKNQTPKGKEEIIQVGKDFGQQWKLMTDVDKKFYLEKAENLKNHYNKELQVWKDVNADEISKWNDKLKLGKKTTLKK